MKKVIISVACLVICLGATKLNTPKSSVVVEECLLTTTQTTISTTFTTANTISTITPVDFVISPPKLEAQQIELSDVDIEMIAYVLANEVNNLDYHYKVAVAEIIRNHLLSDLFPNTIYDVLHNGYGEDVGYRVWGAIDNYYDRKEIPNDEVYQAIEEVFYNGSDITKGAIAYRNVALSDQSENDWWDTLEITYIYSQTLWNREYETTFYKLIN